MSYAPNELRHQAGPISPTPQASDMKTSWVGRQVPRLRAPKKLISIQVLALKMGSPKMSIFKSDEYLEVLRFYA